MNDPQATYVATCYAFVPTEIMLKRRRLARQAKARKDPGGHVLVANLLRDVMSALLAFDETADARLDCWFGTADRLAYVHPSGVTDLVIAARPAVDDDGRALDFITAVGPRSYWPETEANAYKASLESLARGGTIEELVKAAKVLVAAARRREASWSREEWQFRIAAAITAWIFWDDEPGARRLT
jgi:hypothetical protein